MAGGYTDTVFRGYDFHLVEQVSPRGPTVQVRVTEPIGTNYTGSIYCGVVFNTETPLEPWFAPNERAGALED